MFCDTQDLAFRPSLGITSVADATHCSSGEHLNTGETAFLYAWSSVGVTHKWQ